MCVKWIEKIMFLRGLCGSPGRTRTADLVVNSHVLYQLSYRGKIGMTIDTLRDDSGVLWEGQPPLKILVKLLTFWVASYREGLE